MLRAYGPDCDGSIIDPRCGTIPLAATWIDLEEPTRDEEKLVERAMGLEVPTREELAEIEPSSRFYEKDQAIYATMSTLTGVEDGEPASTPIGFVLTSNRLVTVRYATPKPVRSFMQHLHREPALAQDGTTVLVRLLDAIADRLADELESAGDEIERISNHIFRRESPEQRRGRRIPTARLESLLHQIGRAQGLLARIRETALSFSRLTAFLGSTDRIRGDSIGRERINALATDVASLSEHSAFLSSNLIFLLDASLGLISVEQNAIIKIFSVAAVIFLPPTLVGTLYGMNFEHMPELGWLFGYPFALALMAMSAVLPYWFFKRRGWL